MKIWILEDNRTFADTLAIALQKRLDGQRVTIEISSTVADMRTRIAEHADGQPPCLLILDSSLPDGKGEDVVDSFRELFPNSDVTLLSARSPEEILQNCAQIQGVTTLSKSLDIGVNAHNLATQAVRASQRIGMANSIERNEFAVNSFVGELLNCSAVEANDILEKLVREGHKERIDDWHSINPIDPATQRPKISNKRTFVYKQLKYFLSLVELLKTIQREPRTPRQR